MRMATSEKHKWPGTFQWTPRASIFHTASDPPSNDIERVRRTLGFRFARATGDPTPLRGGSTFGGASTGYTLGGV